MGAIRRSPRLRGLRVVHQLGERCLVVGAQERLGLPDPDRAEGPRHVVDEVGQRLGDRGARHGADEVVHLQGRPAGVEGATDRAAGEAVDGGATAGLDVGQEVEGPGQLGLQRPGCDRRQVGLEEDVVDRLGQVRGDRGERGVVVVGEDRPAGPGQAAGADESEQPGLVHGRRDQVAVHRGPSRSQPGHALDERGHPGAGRQHRALRERRQLGQCERPRLGRHHAGEVGGERVPRLAAGVLGADQARQPGGVEPGQRQRHPALGGRARGPGVEGVGGQPDLVAVRVGGRGQQPGGGGHLDQQPGLGLGDLQLGSGRLQVAHTQPAAAQRRGRLEAPVVEEQLGAAYDVEGRAAGGPVDQCRVALGGREHGHLVARRGRGVAVPQRDPDLAREDEQAAVARDEEPVGDAAPRPGSWHRPATPSAARCRSCPRRRWPGRAPAGRGPAGLIASRRAATSPGVPGSADIGRRPLTPAASSPRRASPTPLSGRSPPGDSQISARSTSRSVAASVGGGIGMDDPEKFGLGGLVCNHEGIKDGELEPGEVVERPEDRRTSGGARRKLCGIVRCRSGKIGTHRESAASRSSGHRRNWSASVRGGACSWCRHPFYATRRAPAVAHRRRG